MSNSTARNSFDTNHPKKVADAIKFVRKLKRERSVCAVAHFDLTSLYKKYDQKSRKHNYRNVGS